MELDKYQQAWQAQASQQRVTVDADLLLNEVRRNQWDFRKKILRRDVIEVGVGLLMLPYWLYQGATRSLPWTWYLTVPAILWVVGYFVIDRLRHRQTPNDSSEPLRGCVETSLSQNEHQIWLLRNVFWWYLLPFTISIQTFFAHSAWLSSNNVFVAIATVTPFFLFLTALYCFLDYLNQRAIRTDLALRREELLQLLGSLDPDEPTQATDATDMADPTSAADLGANDGVLRRWLIVTVLSYALFTAFLLAAGKADTSYDGEPRTSGPQGDTLASLVTHQREEKNLVGLAAMVLVDGRLEAAAAQGERKAGSKVSTDVSDRWHLGGISKSVTATMIARLVEAGQMQWSGTIGEAFLEAPVHEDWKPVTLRQLLNDTAGAPPNFPLPVWFERPSPGPERMQARRDAVLGVLTDEPAYPPGEKNVYSNVGYTIAAAMAEKLTGTSWEDLVKREVFVPLQLSEAGFGPPGSGDDTLEQPRS
ncbi:MAG: serine hydrolase domain-containing protein [Pirellulales bacterium]